jgi:hypothetical protein
VQLAEALLCSAVGAVVEKREWSLSAIVELFWGVINFIIFL